MNKNILKTKKNLTIIFTIIVSLVIITLWISFLSFKYINESRWDLIEFSNLINQINDWKISLNKVVFLSDNFEKDISKRDKRIKRIPKVPRWFINYILIDKKWEILKTNFQYELDTNFIWNINKSWEFYHIQKKENFYIIKYDLKDHSSFILFRKLKYGFSDYIWDVFIFFIITLIFSSLLYFIWKIYVNRAFVSVEENMKDMNNFIHNAGHEFKTPISVIDSNIQLIKDIKKYDESLLDEIKDEAKKLDLLVESLIKLSDIWELKAEKEKVNLKDIINKILINYKDKISLKNIDVKMKIKNDIFIETNKSYFNILLSNLIWNSIKYNIENWKIDISYNNWELIIKDTWIWIAKNDLDKIFERFYKVDSSRNTEWFWIGLSLVKKISDIYNWKLIVESDEDNWSKFIVKF